MQWHPKRRDRNTAERIKRQRYNRKNRARNRMKRKRYYQKLKRDPRFKRLRKIRRRETRRKFYKSASRVALAWVILQEHLHATTSTL